MTSIIQLSIIAAFSMGISSCFHKDCDGKNQTFNSMLQRCVCKANYKKDSNGQCSLKSDAGSATNSNQSNSTNGANDAEAKDSENNAGESSTNITPLSSVEIDALSQTTIISQHENEEFKYRHLADMSNKKDLPENDLITWKSLSDELAQNFNRRTIDFYHYFQSNDHKLNRYICDAFNRISNNQLKEPDENEWGAAYSETRCTDEKLDNTLTFNIDGDLEQAGNQYMILDLIDRSQRPFLDKKGSCLELDDGCKREKAIELISEKLQAPYTIKQFYIDQEMNAFLIENRNLHLVIFRGSVEEKDWNNNYSYKLEAPYQIYGSGNSVDSKIHAGFNNTINALWSSKNSYEGMGEYLDRTVQEGDRVIFAGYSRGGALAMLAGLAFKELRASIDSSIITFGQPRVGNSQFVEQIKEKKSIYLRKSFDDDPVTKLPPMEHSVDHILDKIGYQR